MANDVNAAIEAVQNKKLMEELNLNFNELEVFKLERDIYKPTLYDVHKFLDETVVGEYETRMSIFSTFILSKISTFVSGLSAGGKTTVLDAVCDTLMPGDSLIINAQSDKAIFEMEREIKEATHITFLELNKVNPMIIEIVKSFAENKKYEYKRARIQGGNKTFILEPRAVAFTRADESAAQFPISDELMSRMVELCVDGSEEQTIDILNKKADVFSNPFEQTILNNIQRANLKYHISNIPEYTHIINISAASLIKFIPTTFVTSRRDFVKYINNIDGITRFHYKDRIDVNIQGVRVLFSTPEDIFLNHLIFGENLIASAIRCSELEKNIISILPGNGANKSQIQSALRNHTINLTLTTVETHLKSLVDIGYLTVELQGRNNIYSVSDFYKSFDVQLDMQYIIDKTIENIKSASVYNDISDEYIDKFCNKDAMIIQHPFDASKINMLDYEFNSVLVTNTDSQLEPTEDEIWSKYV
ncbi:hypothetical protein GQ473_01745 [archaeon]|nr:hypothetical protein [archaeon]